MLSGSTAIGAWSGERLVGFVRAVSDGRFRAYIEDAVVHSSVQREGIGLKLTARLMEELAHIDIVSLFCEERLIPFYEKNGFRYSRSQRIMHRKG